MKSLIFEKKDGTQYKLKDLGIRVVDFEPESLDTLNEITLIPGTGYVVTPLGYGARRINSSFRIQSLELTDYALFRMELFELFVQDDDFYIIDEKDLSMRWHVRSDGEFSLNRSLRTGNFDISFLCVNPYAFSDKSTMDFNGSKFWDDDLFFWNGIIDWDSDLNYVFTSNTFDVYNLGNAKVDPRSQMLEISINATVNSRLSITNNTTGDVYIYNGNLNRNDTLLINRTRSLKNGASVFKNTNHSLISLNPGVNKFTVVGADNHEIRFNFKYLFK